MMTEQELEKYRFSHSVAWVVKNSPTTMEDTPTFQEMARDPEAIGPGKGVAASASYVVLFLTPGSFPLAFPTISPEPCSPAHLGSLAVSLIGAAAHGLSGSGASEERLAILMKAVVALDKAVNEVFPETLPTEGEGGQE